MRLQQAGDTDRGSNTIQPPLLITMENFQQIIGCGKTTSFAIVKRGEVETVQIGRRRMAVMESVRAYIERLREKAKSQMSEAA